MIKQRLFIFWYLESAFTVRMLRFILCLVLKSLLKLSYERQVNRMSFYSQ